MKFSYSIESGQNIVLVKVNKIQTDRSAKVNVRFESLHYSFVARIPDSQRLIVGRANDKLAARMEDNTSHPIVMPNKSEKTNSGTYIPYANCLVSRSGCKKRSLMCTLIVSSSRCINRSSCAFGRPCDTFYHVFVFSELDLVFRIILH